MYIIKIFNFILLNLTFSEYNIFLPFIIALFITWFIFFKINFINIKVFTKKKDKIVKQYFNKNINYTFYLNLNKIIVVLLIISLFFFKGYSSVIWWNHFKISNFTLILIFLFYFINFLYLLVCTTLFFHKNSYRSDFFFTILNLSILLPTLLLVNNLFTFFFFLEVNSALVFYKFVTTNCWNYKKKKKNLIYKNNLSKTFLNMLFFQYWSSFFSSIMIVYSIITYLYLYGTTEWIFINSLNFIQNNNYSYVNYINYLIINIILIFAFLIKIGMTPIHLYKLEIYKGIPYVSIFFYTTFYFLIFFLFFIILLLNYLTSIVIFYWYLLIIIVIYSSFYCINLLFNVNLLKIFFAYSSIINSLGFLCAVLSLILN